MGCETDRRGLEVARSNLMERLKERTPASPPVATESLQDTHLLRRIQTLVKTRPTYGYRRVTALLNQGVPAEERINHKRVYRMMRDHGLLLSKYAEKPQRTHEGKVMTLKSNLRWCSDIFEIRCWNGDRVFVSFSLDCCDREVLSFVAQPQHLLSENIQDLMAMSLEQRFGRDCMRLPHAIEWLSDNGPQYIYRRRHKRLHKTLVLRYVQRHPILLNPMVWLRHLLRHSNETTSM